ncbi:MAG: asparagine--tRNA ligase [Balneolales bacterium]
MVYIDHISEYAGKEVTLRGWVYNIRTSKKLIFIIVRDGTGLCQSVIAQDDVTKSVWDEAFLLQQESAVELTGKVHMDDRSTGGYELHVNGLKTVSLVKDYPITPKEHGVEFLMEHRHLWLRSRKQWAAMRIRNTIIYAIHRFFQERGFVQMDAPIFTGNAAEGTTNLFETDYFDRKAYLTQSGQLYGEAMAMAHGKIYTFGPTFRAEKSKTRRHLTEFWMIEPEMAYYDLEMNMDLAEELIAFIVFEVVRINSSELELLERNVDKLKRIQAPFPRITYTEAVERLKSTEIQQKLDQMESDRSKEMDTLKIELPALDSEFGHAKKGRKLQIDKRKGEIHARMQQIEEDLRNIPVWKKSALKKRWGEDFGGSDETLLTMDELTPVMVYGYPADVKAFYMKRDPDHSQIALGVDMLAPEGYGEIIGGGQREDDFDTLMKRIKEHNLPEDKFKWYLDLRRFGSVPHAGFGLGLERTVAWLCGLKHVRETIPFPRMLGRLYP